jgi:simple sugar transport system ATP-binding protein
MFVDAGEIPMALDAPDAGEAVVVATRAEIRDSRGITRVLPSSFTLSRGEIIGVAAVEGSGHHELLAALAGRSAPASGTLQRPGRVALIPTNRTRDAVIPEFTLVENVALKGAGERAGRMPWRALTDRTAALMARFDVVATGPHARMATLSGGNQQRMVVARELEDTVDLVVADDPTRGLDLRASAFVHDQLRAAAARGAAVVFHSSDLDELLSLATRVMVVFHGQLREVGRDRDEVGRAMVGAS